MAANDEPKTRYPKQEVSEGQEHGYIGTDVEVYDPATGKAVGHGISPKKAGVPDSTPVQGTVGVTKRDDTDDTDDEAPAAGGQSGGTIRRGDR